MSETKEPIIHISGTVTEKDYTDAVRAHGIRYFLKYAVIYILAVLLFDLGVSFYYWYPDLKDGSVPFAEWLKSACGTFFSPSLTTYLIAGFFVFFALYLIIIRPMLAKKRIPEPEDFSVQDYTEKVFWMFDGPQEEVTLTKEK